MKKKLLVLVVVVVVALVAFVGYSAAVFPPHHPDAERPQLSASTDPEVIAQGEYLFHAVAHCSLCHATQKVIDAAPDISKTAPIGGREWGLGPMGTLRSANITSDKETGIGGMSDAELARILKVAVRGDDSPALMMVAVGPMVDADIVALMSYVRTLPPVKNPVQPSEISLMGKVVLPRAARAYVSPKPQWKIEHAPRGETSVARGAYLANGPGFCFACHSDVDLDTLAIVGPPFAGCVTPGPNSADATKEDCAPNLTPDKETGYITKWSEDEFVSRMGAGRVIKGSPMPWENYKLMDESDARSIYRYLMSLPPSQHDTGPTHREAGWSGAK